MRWEERLLDVFDDLEQQAEGLALAERDAMVAEQSRAEYAAVDLAARVHASVGNRVVVDVAGVGPLDATLARAGAGWCLLAAGPAEWIVRLEAVRSVRGLADGAVAEPARPVAARLGVASAVRAVAGARSPVLLHRQDGGTTRGLLGRVGRDFVEVAGTHEVGGVEVVAGVGGVEVVPFAAVAAVRSG
jgi:hypothetical protein